MRFLSNLLSAIAGVFRRDDPDTEPDASASATIELTSDDIEMMEDAAR